MKDMLKALKDLNRPMAFTTPGGWMTLADLTNGKPYVPDKSDPQFYGITLCNAVTLAYRVLVLGDYYAQSTNS